MANKKLTALSILLVISITGCLGNNGTKLTTIDKIMSVSDFDKDPTLRKKVLLECRSSPGTLSTDPNCVNAGESEANQLIKAKPPRF